MNSWDFRVIQGSEGVAVHEVHYGNSDQIVGWRKEPIVAGVDIHVEFHLNAPTGNELLNKRKKLQEASHELLLANSSLEYIDEAFTKPVLYKKDLVSIPCISDYAYN